MWPNPQFPPFFVLQRQFNHICALSNNNNNNNFASNTTYEKNISNDSNFLTIIYYDIYSGNFPEWMIKLKHCSKKEESL